ncbi:hypothetical protein QVD17_28016 [Tagetes erecta]|uniref:Uncharacterized protein n=1 Tax=Tagetes erecta TaxID=13708 RepID=A0AAD8KC39_TARER|nr:hypothetical protein QVD17_28016 [Tagetes erecta]
MVHHKSRLELIDTNIVHVIFYYNVKEIKIFNFLLLNVVERLYSNISPLYGTYESTWERLIKRGRKSFNLILTLIYIRRKSINHHHEQSHP